MWWDHPRAIGIAEIRGRDLPTCVGLLRGTQRESQDYSPQSGKRLDMHCMRICEWSVGIEAHSSSKDIYWLLRYRYIYVL